MDINSAAVGKAVTNTNIFKWRAAAELQAESPLRHTITCGYVV